MDEVDEIDFEAGRVTLYPSGESAPITSWLGPDGSVVPTYRGAFALVAGPTRSGEWVTHSFDPIFDTQEEAVAFAVGLPGRGVVYVHGKDGRIQERIPGAIQ